MTLSEIDVEGLLKRLHLAYSRHNYRAHIQRAETDDISNRDFLTELMPGEASHRQETRTQRFTRRARFPFLKTIDDFNFTHQTVLRPALIGSYLSPDFVTEGRSLILCGKTGRGKTHLAVAIVYRAIQNGFEALLTTAAALTHYTHPQVLVIDEVGYPLKTSSWIRMSTADRQADSGTTLSQHRSIVTQS